MMIKVIAWLTLVMVIAAPTICQESGMTTSVFSSPIFDLSQSLHSIALKQKTNFAISSTSIYLCLSMLYEGCTGANRNELQHLLNLPVEDCRRRKEIRKLMEYLNKVVRGIDYDEEYHPIEVDVFKTVVANGAWVKKEFSIKPTFAQILKDDYSADIRGADFRSQSTVDDINTWVSDHTNGLIKNALGSIPEETLLILVNTVYFKALWMSSFQKESTIKLPFNDVHDNKKDKDFMVQYGFNVNYLQIKGVELLELPYRTGRHSMIFRFGKSGTDHITRKEINKLMVPRVETRSNLKIPKVDFASDFDLISYLKQLGVSSIFRPSKSNGFSGISDTEGLEVNGLIHKTQVIIDEAGTEAAAVTILMVGVTSVMLSKPKDIVLDHPFSFYIYDKDTEMILFSGVYAE